ncbi:MAG: flagellar basal body P-ring protein FlgI [Gemmataceae bacterium]|nr:flagellar basal body P-ring protein FlgI [Gemmataceae bacterium]
MNRGLALLAAALFALGGCAQTATRFQAEEEKEKDPVTEVKTIGDFTSVANADPVSIGGVGLVVGLSGTGGGAPPGNYRTMLEEDLRKRNIENIKELLNSPDTALVLVSAQIPPGARKGDPLDLEVTLPPQSKVTSLRGGMLKECSLFSYENTRNLSSNPNIGSRNLVGHVLGKAQGPLLVGFGDGDEAATQKRGRIWGGGRCEIDRPFYLLLNADQQYARVAMRIGERLNETFQGPYRGTPLADAKTKNIVYLRPPQQYKHNLPRFLRVVRLVPYVASPAVSSPYRRKLEEDLLDSSRTVSAALRLEALGTDTIPILKRGLTSPHCLVRFTSAEALAYLGSPACGEELGKLIQDQPVLRAYCLTALASLDEAVCHVQLRDLLTSNSAETRYGAFRALRALDDRDPTIRGEQLNDSFWLHRVAPDSSGMVHVSSSRRAEIVFFGQDAYLEPPFSFLAGPEFTVTAARDDELCTISRFSTQYGARRKQCSLKLIEVLHTLAELGAQYPEAVELVRQADKCQCVSCPVKVDALPEATSVYELARSGKLPKDGGDADLLRSDAEVMNARAEFSATPTLFDDGTRHRPKHGHDAGEEN